MAVTDLTDSLPYWARQGGAGPGATGGPAAAPQGSGGLPQPPPGVDPAQWLQYLSQMFSPGAAQAAGNDPMAALRSGGSPVPQALSGGGPPVPPGLGQGAQPMRPPNSAGMPPGALSSANLGAFNNMPAPSGGGGLNPNAPSPAAQPVSMAPSAANPLAAASGGAAGSGATSNPRFLGISAPNASPQNSMRGGPQGTALNLAGLFGRGGGAPGGAGGAPGAAPAAANPVPGPLANAPMPPVMPRDVYKRRTMLPNY